MSSGVKKTNAMRMLDSAKIPYEVRTYEFEETDLAGVHAADAVGMPYETVFKTLVARGDKTGFVVFCIPVAEELDLKKAARASKNKSVELLHVKDLLPTLYPRRLLARGHEEGVPDVYRRDRHAV